MKFKIALTLAALLFIKWGFSQNPIIQTSFTADPAPMVHNGVVYVYTTHDEDETVNNFFTMFNWRCYSSADMVNWTDHGVVASLDSFKWSDKTNGAWAPQAIERNGKFYLYCPIHGDGIGVLVADSPTGPFSDPLGRRLVVDSENVWNDIDPTVFIDDDGQAYLMWGNPALFYVKLNEDMISYDLSIGKKGIVAMEMKEEALGKREKEDVKYKTNYEEAPWLYKRNDLYYLVYAAGGIPEKIAYSTAPSAEGPWTYRGIIMDRAPQLAFTNHPGIVDFKEKSWFFYHSQELSGKGFQRSVCLEQFGYNADGSIPLLVPTKEGVKESVSNLNPFERVEAETIARSEGLKTALDNNTGMYVTRINNGNFIKVRSVDFGRGAKSFRASVASANNGGSIEIHLGSPQGQLIGTCKVKNTRGKWKTVKTKTTPVEGVHDLYFVFKGGEGELFNFDWWGFERK
jgi:arabinoxylan arabinofuranohydrolase